MDAMKSRVPHYYHQECLLHQLQGNEFEGRYIDHIRSYQEILPAVDPDHISFKAIKRIYVKQLPTVVQGLYKGASTLDELFKTTYCIASNEQETDIDDDSDEDDEDED